MGLRPRLTTGNAREDVERLGGLIHGVGDNRDSKEGAMSSSRQLCSSDGASVCAKTRQRTRGEGTQAP